MSPPASTIEIGERGDKMSRFVRGLAPGALTVLMACAGATAQRVPWAAARGFEFEQFDTALADVDGDGDLDAVSLRQDEATGLCTMLNNGDGTFELGALQPLPDEPRSLAVGDFDGDGDPDVAVLR